ncbi:MAG: DUF481 domain-containing protein [Myxococcaceae bacterium]
MNRFVFGLLALSSFAAVAQADPAFKYEKAPDTGFAPAWDAQVRAGLLFNTGNARQLAVSASGMVSYENGFNRARVDADGALARSQLISAVDADGSGDISPNEYGRTTATTAQNWLIRARYDRFFGMRTSVFAAGRIGSDVPSGKQLYGGAQAGVSQMLIKTDMSELVGEVGYDFTAEQYISIAGINIHSLRAAMTHAQTLSKTASLNLFGELLLNLNEEAVPYSRGGSVVPAFADIRFNFGAALQVRIIERVSLAVGFKLRYDAAPAPRPAFAPGLPFAAGFRPFAQELDTVTDATIQVDLI